MSTQPIPKVTERSKKEEILSAYQQLIKKFEEDRERTSHMTVERENKLIEEASGFSMEGVVENMAKLEGDMRGKLNELVEALLQELKKLKNVKDALDIAQQRLQEVHGIHAEADAFAQIVDEHKAKKRQLEEEYERQEQDIIRTMEDKKEEWRREEQQYEYELALKHKKEDAEYQLKKESRERMLKEQETALAQQKQELEDLRLWKKNFETKLENELEQREQDVTQKIKTEYDMKALIAGEKYAAEKRVSELTIESLKNRLAQYEQDVMRLKKELEIANAGVKDIALKVIEGGNRMNEQHRSMKTAEMERPREAREAA